MSEPEETEGSQPNDYERSWIDLVHVYVIFGAILLIPIGLMLAFILFYPS